MIRSFFEVIGLFALPFMIYLAACLVIGHPLNVFTSERRKHLFTLVLAGLMTSVVGILVLGFFESHKMGAFQPAHMENGKLIDGKILPEALK